MYCKNCGRQLKEGVRFCDRCGQSVRKSSASGTVTRREEIEELKAERLNRKRRLEEKEARAEVKKRGRKRRGNAVLFVLLIIVIAAASFVVGMHLIDDGGIQQSDTPAATGGSAVSSASSASQGEDKNGYSTVTIGNLSCPYPSSFHVNTVSGSETLNLTDPLGGATMTVQQIGKSGVPKDLMVEYLEETGGKETESRAGSDYYTITIESGDKIYHRKCIIRSGIAVYYDFIYNQGSSSESKYKEYISYIDSNFK